MKEYNFEFEVFKDNESIFIWEFVVFLSPTEIFKIRFVGKS